MDNVAVVDASPNEERYYHNAMKLLEEKGHTSIPVSPRHEMIGDAKVYPGLSDIPCDIDPVTVHGGNTKQSQVIDDIISASPKRVIFNPGAENAAVYERIEVVEACALVLLNTGQF